MNQAANTTGLGLNLRRLEEALRNCRGALLQRLAPDGNWAGRLSSSALSTAVAVVALSRMGREPGRVQTGLQWLAQHQNADGGWGDTPESPSNISTTLLSWAAFHHNSSVHPGCGATVQRAEVLLTRQLGTLQPSEVANRIIEHYGRDRTFSVPILTMCALCGRLGPPEQAWKTIPQLPFELAALPHQLFAMLRLPVVSYAIPALIAMGLARHENASHRSRLLDRLREGVKPTVLRVLRDMQPATGGFLEAVPLTGFVVMSLAASGLSAHPVAEGGAKFLQQAQRSDGSWPIDVDLNTWLTALSVESLQVVPGAPPPLDEGQRQKIVAWLLAQQHRREHPFTHAQPGGWAWTNLAGGVPDADDTSGVLLALRYLNAGSVETREGAAAGIKWLLDLQNRDGGLPTFCRGWLNLPFDRSCPDITAHALAAWSAWREHLPAPLQARVDRARRGALRYLIHAQREDGAWVPLWFGSQEMPDHSNPLYGTARVLWALRQLPPQLKVSASDAVNRATTWLLNAQCGDGGWGAAACVAATIEETALAITALSATGASVSTSVARGLQWLLQTTCQGTRFPPAPMGLYFSKLWYSEELYPIIFTCSALSCSLQDFSSGGLTP